MMKKVTLENITIDEVELTDLTILLDDDGNVIVLPLLFSVFINRTGNIKKVVRQDKKTIYTHETIEEVIDSSMLGYYYKVYVEVTYDNKGYRNKFKYQ